ncbi:MAG TPA: SdrD B-like domain-containing protein [Candidatus Methylomirabilis sp.]|nr:SdrD B-like domain-containing protein [Candidatus Methylomirabilis sp.]
MGNTNRRQKKRGNGSKKQTLEMMAMVIVVAILSATIMVLVPGVVGANGTGNASISGMKFNDLNNNSIKDPAEPGLAGWTINLKDSNGSIVATNMTDSSGSYTFSELAEGNYTVEEVQQSGWIHTAPLEENYTITLSAEENVTGKDFGNIKIANVMLETPDDPLFIGSYVKVPVLIDPDSGLKMEDLSFIIPEGPKGGIVSLSRDKDFNPDRPDIMLCAGYEPGMYTLQALNNSTIVGEAKFSVTDLWKDDSAGPSLCFEGVAEGFSAGSAWGGGPAGPQNINVHPALGTRRVAVLLVDTSSQRFTASDGINAKNRWDNETFKGVTTGGVTRSVKQYYQEVSYGKFDISGEVFGPVNLSGSWDDYLNSTTGAPKAGFYQECITAGDSLINYNNFDSVVCVSLSVVGPPAKSAWPYAGGGTLKTAEGDKSLGMISMPKEWGEAGNREVHDTLSHEIGHNLGLADQYDSKYGPVIGARTIDSWDMMDWDDPLPHFSIAHRMMLGWVPAGQIQTFNFASMGAPVDQTVTLNPIEQGTPPAGSFSGIEVRVADGNNYYFEYRIGQSAQIGDRQLPVDSRVLSTDVASPSWSPPILRPDILLLSNAPGHGNGPVLGNGQYYTETVNDPIYPTDFNASVSNINGNKADIRITYGINSKPDPSIRPWPAGPDRQWQSPDIEIQNARNMADPAWFNVPWAGNVNTVIASVKNAGNLDASGVQVDFYVKDYTIGNAPETFLGSDVQDIAKGATVQFKTTWIPPKEGHFCIIVRIRLYFKPGPPAVVETTELNNVAQSNYDKFISTQSVPSREITTVRVGNPYPNTTTIFIVPGQSNPLYRTYVEKTSLVLGPYETRNVKVMFEYIGGKINPERCRLPPEQTPTPTPPIITAQRATNNELPDPCIPNNVGITGYIEDPRDPRPDSIQVLGGVQAQVSTGLSTEIREFSASGRDARGTVISTDDGMPVPGGKVILRLTRGCGESQTKTYTTVDVSTSGQFSANVEDTWDSIEAYYVPLTGYGDSISQRIFRKYCGEINGMKFNDSNGNGINEPGDDGLSDWTIVLKNSTGATVGTDITDSNGNYTFSELAEGNYTVEEVLQSGWAQRAPPEGKHTLTLSAGENVTGKDFGNFKTISPTGNRINGKITYSNNGTGIPDVSVDLINMTGTIASTTTDSSGSYNFSGVPPGDYSVNVSRMTFFGNSTAIILNASETKEVNLVLWLKGDLNNNGIPADAGDLVLMKRASIEDIEADFRYDLNNNGQLADAGDLVLMKRASIGEISL